MKKFLVIGCMVLVALFGYVVGNISVDTDEYIPLNASDELVYTYVTDNELCDEDDVDFIFTTYANGNYEELLYVVRDADDEVICSGKLDVEEAEAEYGIDI